MKDCHKAYYQANKEVITNRSKKRYEMKKDGIKRTTAEYRKSEDYKKSKAISNQRVKIARRKSSIKAELQGKLGVAYTDIEDTFIIQHKEEFHTTYQVIADELSRSMKGVEYRYNLLRKRREAGDDSIPTFLKA